jgi:hypothetical protein
LGKVLWTLVTGQKAFAREQPAFTGKNLSQVLADTPECWHLTSVFEKSIRRHTNQRYKNAAEMAHDCRRIATRIMGRFPPLELVEKLCPACGHEAVEHDGHVDYLHEGHRHAVHGDHYDEH